MMPTAAPIEPPTWEPMLGNTGPPIPPVQVTLQGNVFVLERDGYVSDKLWLGCGVHQVLRHQKSTYILCDNSMALVLSERPDALPLVLERRLLPGSATHLFVHNDSVWVEYEDKASLPFRARPFGRETVLAPNDSGAVTRTLGSVISYGLSTTQVLLDAGAELDPGELVELLPSGPNGRATTGYVMPVLSVTGRLATVRPGFNERVEPGDRARVSSRLPTHTMLGPPRLGDLWQASLHTRGILALSPHGGGFALDARAAYHFQFPLEMGVSVSPIVLAFVPRSSPLGARVDLAGGAVFTSAFVGVDLPFAGLGILFGVAASVTRAANQLDVQPTTGLSMRLGPADGFSIRGEVVVGNWPARVQVLNLKAELQIPLPITWLEFRMSANTDRLLGEMGLRILARGHGDRGSVFIEPLLGGAVFSLRARPTAVLSGLSFGLGIEYRP